MTSITIDSHTLIHGDCREVLQTLPENSVDAIVTDPPYNLGFMGKKWDSTGIAFDPNAWRHALRVLKPGGHMLAFGGSRTFHRIACAIEDAGFEIRDTIMWLYGSGFPKSLDVSKAIDKAAGATRVVLGPKTFADGSTTRAAAGKGDKFAVVGDSGLETAPATDAARQWSGWGTALKPAFEPIILVRKPLIGAVAANVLEHGTGALNIDACRVPHKTVNGGNLADNPHLRGTKLRAAPVATSFGRAGDEAPLTAVAGRWPANVIHDGSGEVLAAFPDAPGQMGSAGRATSEGGQGVVGFKMRAGERRKRPGTGSAARFYYCAKASRADRNDGCDALERRPLNWSSGDQNPGSFQGAGTDRTARNDHPTVKPTELMRYLVRLITPPGGTVLDLFAGSGSTGRACALEGFASINIEQDPHHCDIAAARILAAVDRAQAEAERAEREQGDLFQQEAMA